MVQHQTSSLNEYVKCVVVGDSGVGKTCLICSWASDTRYSLGQLVKTHVSTVWAIDRYRNDNEVLERSLCDVDGTRVSLYLWDTFGYHDKGRGFAYRGADVVLLCFSTSNPLSLKNVKRKWLPEIRIYCPTTPIVLVGTQADLRYMYKEDVYKSANKGLLYKSVSDKDILLPDKGREIAKDIGAPYYETSVLTRYGIEDVFINSIRAALVERRKLRFWMSQLRRIQFPLIQAPMNLPEPILPIIRVPKPAVETDYFPLLQSQIEGDIVFIVEGVCFHAHKICLVIADKVFEDMFLMGIEDKMEFKAPDFNQNDCNLESNDDKLNLLQNEDLLSSQSLKSKSLSNSDSSIQVLNHPAFESMENKLCASLHSPEKLVSKTVVAVSSEIQPKAFHYILDYMYTGQARQNIAMMEDVKTAARLMQLNDLLLVIANWKTQEGYLNIELEKSFRKAKLFKVREIALEKGLLADVAFEVDDGLVFGHKPLLMAKCEMMYAMFSDDFVEASAEVIPFPGLKKETFHALQGYLYTGELPSLSCVDHIALIEVANRLCLPRLVCMMEDYIVAELIKSQQEGDDITDEVMMILEPAQFHNAHQLAQWCQEFLCINFSQMYRHHRKLFEVLQPDNQLYLRRNQWPPLWYRKELEHYEKVVNDNSFRGQIQQKHQFTRWQQCSSMCLCFCRGRRTIMDDRA